MKRDWLSLARQTLTYGAGAWAARAIALLTLPVYFHMLSPVDYGLIGISIAAATGARVVGVVGGSGALGIRYFAAPPQGRLAVLGAAVRANEVSAIAWGAAVLVLLLWVPERSNWTIGSLAPFAVLAACGVAAAIWGEPLMLGLQLEQRARAVVLINIIASAVGGLLGVALVVAGCGVASWAAAHCASSLLVLGAARAHGGATLRASTGLRDEQRALLKAWLPLVPGAALACAMPVATPYVLMAARGSEEAGLFAVASQLASIVVLLTGALSTAWLPYFQARVDRQDEWRSTYRRLVHAHVVGSATLCALVLAFGGTALRWLAADSFAGAESALYALVVANLLASLWSFLLPGTYYAGHTAAVSWLQLTGAVACALVLLGCGAGLTAANAARALALGSGAIVVGQVLVNRAQRYRIHRFGHGWVLLATVTMCTSMYVTR
jgi:O-antigen/teichoic acid export membrane protein